MKRHFRLGAPKWDMVCINGGSHRGGWYVHCDPVGRPEGYKLYYPPGYRGSDEHSTGYLVLVKQRGSREWWVDAANSTEFRYGPFSSRDEAHAVWIALRKL